MHVQLQRGRQHSTQFSIEAQEDNQVYDLHYAYIKVPVLPLMPGCPPKTFDFVSDQWQYLKQREIQDEQ